MVAVVALDPEPHPVTVQAQGSHLPAPQRRGQPGHQPGHHVAVGGVQMPQQVGLERAERVGPGREQVRHVDRLSAGRVGDHHGRDLQPPQHIPRLRPVRAARGVDAQQGGVGAFGGDDVERFEDLRRVDLVQPPAHPDQRPDRLAQRQRRVVGQLEQRRRPRDGPQPVFPRDRQRQREGAGKRAGADEVMDGRGNRIVVFDRQQRAAGADARAADPFGSGRGGAGLR
ncbi:hypothetical protein PICSAR200_04533 [Mycobacterium avium subsp. paratuberculosis]|nr:hypothetical protein PICSAR200_04533 [Mycobacterium avium subsp. paratuberculosis]